MLYSTTDHEVNGTTTDCRKFRDEIVFALIVNFKGVAHLKQISTVVA